MATATLTNGTVSITTGVWSDKFPVERPDYWIAFYRKMVARRPQNYQATLDALISVKEE